MAQNKKKNIAYQRKAGSEFQKGTDNVFTGGGNAAYQPRDANTGKAGQSAGRNKQTEKSMQAHQETFGQKVSCCACILFSVCLLPPEPRPGFPVPESLG